MKTFFLLECFLLTIHGSEEGGSKLMFILLDGFRWDYLDRPGLTGFKTFMENGVRAQYMTVDFPSLSMPNYYTIVTGLHTENHGMVGNNMYDEKEDSYFLLSIDSSWYVPLWWNQAEPFWIQAEKQGKRVYMYYWMGCEVEIDGTRPTFCEPYFWGNGKYPDFPSMSNAISKGIQLFENNSADVVGIYVENPDKYGHYFGPNSVELNNKLKEIDGVVEQLLTNLTANGLTDNVTVMIFSDHGMTEINPERSINITDYIDLDDLRAFVLGGGPVISIWPKNGRIEKVYNRLLEAKTQLGHFDIYRKNEIPDEWHYKNNYRVAPLTLVSDFGWMILQPYNKKFPTSSNGPYKGYHGFDQDGEDMRGIFLVSGPGIKKNVQVNSIHAVDIYQLMCHVTKMTPSPHNGMWSRVASILSDTSSAQRMLHVTSLTILYSIFTIYFNFHW